jgi:hypothetical protein
MTNMTHTNESDTADLIRLEALSARNALRYLESELADAIVRGDSGEVTYLRGEIKRVDARLMALAAGEVE